MANPITFETLLQNFPQLCEDMAFVKQQLLKKSNESQPEADQLLTVQQAAEFLTLAVPTIYSMISRNELPVMKRSKRCYFSKVDLINYLKVGRKKTNTEIENEADTYLQKKHKN